MDHASGEQKRATAWMTWGEKIDRETKEDESARKVTNTAYSVVDKDRRNKNK